MNIASAWFYIAALLPGLSKNLRNEMIDKVILLSSLLEKLGNFVKGGLIDKIMPTTSKPIIPHTQIQTALSDTFTSIHTWFNDVKTGLLSHAEAIGKAIEPDDLLRPWKVFGYFFQLMFLGLFAYADVIQIINNLALIFPQDIPEVPAWMQNLTLSLLMSSVGIAVAGGFILAEFGGITHFGRWNELKGGFRHTVYFLVWFSLFSILVIDGVLAISRIQSIPEVVRVLDSQVLDQLKVFAAIASSLVIIPMLIITALFLEGFKGFAVLYIILVRILVVVAELLHFTFILLVWVLTFGVAYLVGFILRVSLFSIVALLFIASWLFLSVGITFQNVLELIKAISNIAYLPMDFIVGWITKILTKQS